jgi:hypothetical protein
VSADDIVWGRGGGHRVPKGTRAGHGVEDIERIRQEHGGTFAKPAEPADDTGQLDLFTDDPPPAAA